MHCFCVCVAETLITAQPTVVLVICSEKQSTEMTEIQWFLIVLVYKEDHQKSGGNMLFHTETASFLSSVYPRYDTKF